MAEILEGINLRDIPWSNAKAGDFYWRHDALVQAVMTEGGIQMVDVEAGSLLAFSINTMVRPAPDYVVCHRSRVKD